MTGKFKYDFGQSKRILKQIYNQRGIRGIYQGITTIMGQAILANGLGFLAWEQTRSYVQDIYFV